MADCKNRGGDEDYLVGDGKKINLSPCFNRSVTINSTKAAAEITNKPLFSLYTTSLGSMVSVGNSFRVKVRKLCSIFESPKYPSNPATITAKVPPSSEKLLPTAAKNIPPMISDSPFRIPGTEDRVVIYFTNLRGIRRTFQDFHSIRMIFRGFRVNIDERDISMDAAYRKELQKLLGEDNASLPQVFIKGKYIGGADVVKQLLEAGELVRLMKGLPLCASKPCEGCDDVRFMPCTNCDGSRKVFDEEDEQPRRCTECNENGLVRCPLCCS